MTAHGCDVIRIALPSKGHLYEGSLALFRDAGYRIRRPSDRQYEATIGGYPQFHVVFMRPGDIVAQVGEGRCHLGITGMDVYAEHRDETGATHVITESLGFGSCRLTVAVPESWIDVTHILDLVDLTTEFKSAGKTFRVSTKYPNLVRAAFRKWGIYYYQVIASDGALELHPTLGIADIIVDLASSGATLKDNRLKEVEQGTILSSAACLIGHTKTIAGHLSTNGSHLESLLDAIDAVRSAEDWLLLDVLGLATPSQTVEAAAYTAIKALAAAGALHLTQSSRSDAQGKSYWQIRGMARPHVAMACRQAIAHCGFVTIAATPARLLFEAGAASTADRVRQDLG